MKQSKSAKTKQKYYIIEKKIEFNTTIGKRTNYWVGQLLELLELLYKIYNI